TSACGAAGAKCAASAQATIAMARMIFFMATPRGLQLFADGRAAFARHDFVRRFALRPRWRRASELELLGDDPPARDPQRAKLLGQAAHDRHAAADHHRVVIMLHIGGDLLGGDATPLVRYPAHVLDREAGFRIALADLLVVDGVRRVAHAVVEPDL